SSLLPSIFRQVGEFFSLLLRLELSSCQEHALVHHISPSHVCLCVSACLFSFVGSLLFPRCSAKGITSRQKEAIHERPLSQTDTQTQIGRVRIRDTANWREGRRREKRRKLREKRGRGKRRERESHQNRHYRTP